MIQATLKSLVRLGLSEKEAATYAAVLELGSATALEAARKSGVSRPTTYATLETLEKRGLVAGEGKGGTRRFVPEAPQRLEAILAAERADVEGKEKVLAGTLPMLMALFNAEGPKPHVRYLEGEEGLETVRKMFLGLRGEFVQLLSYDDVMERRELHRGQGDHLKKLEGVSARALLVMDEPDAKKAPSLPGAKIRIVSSALIPMRGEITVRGSCVFLYAYHPRILSVVITSKEMAGAVRGLFDLAWRGAQDVSVEA